MGSCLHWHVAERPLWEGLWCLLDINSYHTTYQLKLVAEVILSEDYISLKHKNRVWILTADSIYLLVVQDLQSCCRANSRVLQPYKSRWLFSSFRHAQETLCDNEICLLWTASFFLGKRWCTGWPRRLELAGNVLPYFLIAAWCCSSILCLSQRWPQVLVLSIISLSRYWIVPGITVSL